MTIMVNDLFHKSKMTTQFNTVKKEIDRVLMANKSLRRERWEWGGPGGVPVLILTVTSTNGRNVNLGSMGHIQK